MKPWAYGWGNNKDEGVTFYSAQLGNLEEESRHLFEFKIKSYQFFLLHLDLLCCLP